MERWTVRNARVVNEGRTFEPDVMSVDRSARGMRLSFDL
jgi:hypothetical protein